MAVLSFFLIAIVSEIAIEKPFSVQVSTSLEQTTRVTLKVIRTGHL